MLCYTDGLNEAENMKQELLGNDTVIRLMTEFARMSAEEVIQKLELEVERHRAGAIPNDDLTLLCLRLRKA